MNNLDQFKDLIISKQDLLKCIFGTLIFQILVTTLVFNHVRNNPKNYKKIFDKIDTVPLILLLVALNIFLIFVMVAFNINFYIKFIVFILFSVIQGLFLGAALKYVDHGIINTALISTISIFLVLLVLGLIITYFHLNISWLGIVLFISLISLIIIQITSLFIHESKATNRLATIFGLIIFSLYILYDTNNILLKYKNSNVDCITGALDYYLDIVNIFLETTNLQGN